MAVVRRLVIGIFAALLVAGLVAPAVAAAPPAGAAVPRVVVFVGPSRSATDR
jgi:hypothetical protein